MPAVELPIKAKDRASGTLKGLMGTLIKTQLTIDAVKMAARKLAQIATESVAAFAQQEKAETSLNTALKITGIYSEETAKELQEMALRLQGVTQFGDEASLSALALTQQLGKLNEDQLKTILPRLQDFAAAMDVDLTTAASLFGKTIGASTNALARYGIEIDTSAEKSEKFEQLIGALDEKFGGFAEDIGDTTSGDLAQFDNAIGDLGERFGELIMHMLPAIDTLTEMVVVLGDVVDWFNRIDDKTIAVVSDRLEDAVANGMDLNEALEMTATVTGKTVEKAAELYLINDDLKQQYEDQQAAIQKMFDTFTNLLILQGKAVETVEEQVETVEELSEWQQNFNDIVGELEAEFNKIEESSKWAEAYGNSLDVAAEKQEAFKSAIQSLIDEGFELEGDTIRILMERYDELIEKQEEYTAGGGAGIKEMRTEYEAAAAAMQEESKKTVDQMIRDINRYFQEFGSGIAGLVGTWGQIISQEYANQIENLETSLNEQMILIDEWLAEQLEIYGADEEKRKELEAEAKKRKEEARKETAMKQWALEVRQFKAEQKFKKADIWMNYGLGMIAAAARAAGMGPISGAIYMAAMGSLLTAQSAMATKLVNKQQPPPKPFAEGGIVPGTSFRGDQVPAMVNSGEMILNKGQQANLFGMINGGKGGGITIGNINLPGVTNAQQFVRELKQIARYEGVR